MRRATAELANSSAEQPAECRSTDAADNSKLDHFASHGHASPHFTIFDDADHRTEYKPDEWDSMLDDWARALKHAPAALDGMVWHRYRDPDINQDWLSCATQPELWLYVHELRHLDDKGYFSFQGQWQLVVTPPPTETAAASSTAVTQPDTTDSSGAASCNEKARYAMSVKPIGIRNRALEVGCRRKISVVLYSLLLTVPVHRLLLCPAA